MALKVYFAGSIRGGRVDADLYHRMIEYIQRTDVVLTEHVGKSNLSLTEQENRPLGKYGRLRKDYLKEHRPILWNRMILSETLYSHLREIDETAQSRLETMMPKLMEAAGISEKLKAENPMQWVGLMNNCKAQAEETILRELVYS